MTTINDEIKGEMMGVHMIEPQQLLKRQDLERMFQVSGRTIFRMIESGRLPPPIFFSKRMCRWKLEDVESYLSNEVAE